MRKNYVLTFFLVILIILTGCQGEEEVSNFSIGIFSNLPDVAKQNVENIAQSTLGETEVIQVEKFAPFREKLILEIVDRSGDILIVDREILPTILDPGGLIPLDEIKGVKDITGNEGLKGEDENGIKHFYALPVSNEKIVDGQIATDLVAVIPIYTKYKEEALQVLKELVD